MSVFNTRTARRGPDEEPAAGNLPAQPEEADRLGAAVGPDQPDARRDALTLTPDNYGPLWRYVSNDDITDADFNGTDLWVTDAAGRRTQVSDHGITSAFVRAFSQRVANKVSKPFNKMHPLLEAETSTLRISILHESAAVSGRSICLRKSLANVRMTPASIIADSYMPREVMNLLVNCIRARMNVVIAGGPGAGKTELAKFLTQYIPDDERVITIEDSPEWHYREINPGHDCVEMRVDGVESTKDAKFTYSDAIKTCLRQNPKWIMLSEARGEEAKWLITSWSTGVNGVTTFHTDDIRKIPSRLIAMMNDRNDAERMEADIYDFVNVAILVRRKAMPDGTQHRYIDQLGFLYRDLDGAHGVAQLVKDGRLVSEKLPEDTALRLERAEIDHPFECAAIDHQVGDTYTHPASAPHPVGDTSMHRASVTRPVAPPPTSPRPQSPVSVRPAGPDPADPMPGIYARLMSAAEKGTLR
jgi:pilus assembly protein CpaF